MYMWCIYTTKPSNEFHYQCQNLEFYLFIRSAYAILMYGCNPAGFQLEHFT